MMRITTLRGKFPLAEFAALIILGLCLLQPSHAQLFTDVPCDFLIGVANELEPTKPQTQTHIHELAVYANRDFSANTRLETQPAATIPVADCYYSILNHYAHGFNRTHAVIFFGSSSLFNHGLKNRIDNVYVRSQPTKFSKAGSNDVAVMISSNISKFDEMFSFYLAEVMTQKETALETLQAMKVAAKAAKGSNVYLPWFETRGLKYVDTNDTKKYPGRFVDGVTIMADGCADNKHLDVSPDGVKVLLEVRNGDVIETNRVLFVYQDVAEEEPIDQLFWTLSPNKKALSIGIVLPFAKFTTDEKLVNAKMSWWQDQVHYGANMGIISVTAIKDIKPNEDIILQSLSDTQRVFTKDISDEFMAKRTWWDYIKEVYDTTSLKAKMYAALIGAFGIFALLV